MAGSIQAGADIIDNSGYHNSAFHFQLKIKISGKGQLHIFHLSRFPECPISGRSSGLNPESSHTYYIALVSYCGN